MNKKAEKKESARRASTRQLIGTKAVTEYSLVTYGHGELVYFLVKPSNISVLSEASVGARIYALMTVLKGIAEIEILCLNSRENFEDNKRYLRERMEREDNPVVRGLLEKDLVFLDRIQVQMATAREFLIVIRLRDEKESELLLTNGITGDCHRHGVRLDPCVEGTPGYAGIGAYIRCGFSGSEAGDQGLFFFCTLAHGLIPPVQWYRIPLYRKIFIYH